MLWGWYILVGEQWGQELGGGVGGVCVITFKNFGPQKVKNPEGELKIEPQDVHVYLHGRDFPS